MSKPSEAFIDGAYGTLNALRLFAHNARLEEAVFYIAEGIRSDTIQFRAIQCWCDISRDADGLTIKVTPVMEATETFVSRILKLPRSSYQTSALMTLSDNQMLANNGRDYARLIANLFDLHQQNSHMVPYRAGDTDHVILVSAANDSNIVQQVDQIASALNHRLDRDGLTIHIAHPSFDLEGGIKLINEQSHICDCPPVSALDTLPSRLAELDAAAKRLPPALRFDQLELGFPATYGIMPHAYTMGLTTDRTATTIQAMKASAELGIDNQDSPLLSKYHVTVICTKPARDPVGRASAILLEDWTSKPACIIKPSILSHEIELETETHFEVRLHLLADRESAEAYNETGCYDVLPA